MEDLILEAFGNLNLGQTAVIIIAIVVSYFKMKKQTNGLGSRFDRQFGEYKTSNRIKLEDIELRIVKLETEKNVTAVYERNTQAIIEKLDKLVPAHK